MRPLLATLLLAVNVMASPTGTPLIPLFDGIITDSLAVGATTSVVHQSNVQHAVPTSVPGVVRVASSPPLITSVPTKLPFSEGTNMTLQRSTPLSSLTTPSSVVPVIVLMESGDSTLSGRDIAAIVIGFTIFVALHVALFCLWRKYSCCGWRPQTSQSPAPPRAHARVAISISRPPVQPRPSSASTFTSSSDGRKGNTSLRGPVEVPNLELLPVVRRPSPARHSSRPRVPLMEGAF